ncbi:ATP-binding protein [Clostridium beijerinckii]|uniref:Histidine kinase n=2 Tax=Clostridium TaxID=1485 RepID=A0A1S9NDC9_CLOBE|nr:GHKL domain-containing protein [Clostridium beijerinckii]MBN7577121.1 GHKL domain-containing protein [Clostridium beijerinckii]MBN7582027.1 GHKL domain-containing protein [Clostridium beijerinckii]MBN7586887.1 GHKL domain-containing protein [Clostridium beijerinckii]MBO0523087.1 GHKL domain-containing protein [Clostridium beijerinckii]MZK52382.1 GHKL domain-containing protein [Clostridium beijerinckii]
MLNSFIINSLDTFNIIYLWAALNKKNNNIAKLLSIILIVSILTTIVEQLGVNFIITYIMIVVVIKAIYKIGLKEIILGFLFVLLVEISLQLMLSLIVDKLFYNNNFGIIIIELITLICIIIFSKVSFLNKTFSFEKIDSNILIYLILTCGIYAVVFKIIWNYDNKMILNNLFIATLILSVLVISQILTYLYIMKVIREKEKLKLSNEYNAVIDEIIQEIKQRQHDFINYKNTIRGIVEVVDNKDLKSAITNYIKDEDTYDNKVNELIYIDNIVVRSIIYRNICKAKKDNVNFQYKIENNVLDNILSYHEISNVLNNLLNNAFDEVMKEKCIKKNIEVRILNEKNASHLIVKNQIVNSSDLNLNEMFTRGYSTKNIGTRGYGLYNVQQIINSHKGYIKINFEYGEIIFDIYFNSSSGKSGSP